MKTLNQLVRKNILDLSPYSSARDEFSGSAEILLDANENPFGIYNRYPDPYQKQVKLEWAALKNIHPDRIFIGNGSDEAIDLLFRIFCEPGKDKALTFAPTYGMYKVSAQINDVTWIELPLDDSYQINYGQFAPYCGDEHLKLVFICSPNNPTGNAMDRKTLIQILENFQGMVVIDEAYIDFSEEESCLTLLQTYPNLVVLQTLSKAWGQAGLRIGFAFAQEEVIRFFNKVKPPYNVSTANQSIALRSLKDYNSFIKTRKVILAERKRLKETLSQISNVETIFPSEANFLLIRFKNASFIYHTLVQKNIIVRDRSAQIKNTLRITIGTPAENNKLIQTLQQIAL